MLAFWASSTPAAAASRAARSNREVEAGRMAANRWLCVLSTAAMKSHGCAVCATDLADNLLNTAYATLSSLLSSRQAHGEPGIRAGIGSGAEGFRDGVAWRSNRVIRCNASETGAKGRSSPDPGLGIVVAICGCVPAFRRATPCHASYTCASAAALLQFMRAAQGYMHALQTLMVELAEEEAAEEEEAERARVAWRRRRTEREVADEPRATQRQRRTRGPSSGERSEVGSTLSLPAVRRPRG